MLEILFSLMVFFLSVVGLSEVARLIYLRLVHSKDDASAIIVLPISGHMENVELVLRNAVGNVKWLSGGHGRKVVCLDLGMDSETRQICYIFSRRHACVEVSLLEDFVEELVSRTR